MTTGENSETTQEAVSAPDAIATDTSDTFALPGDSISEEQAATVELVLDCDFDTYSPDKQQRLLRAISELLDATGEVKLVRKRRGSVILTLELSRGNVPELVSAIKQGRLAEFRAIDVFLPSKVGPFDELLSVLPVMHRHYGNFSRATIFIIERSTENENVGRVPMRVGTLPELVVHGVRMVQEFTASDLVWSTDGEMQIKRLERTIVPTACVRGRMLSTVLPNDIDTASIVELMVEESLGLIDSKEIRIEEFTNVFYVLIVCGEGLAIAEGVERDLKAAEVCWKGGTQEGGTQIVIDFDAKGIAGIPETIVQHTQLRGRRSTVDRYSSFGEAAEIARILKAAADLSDGKRLPAYRAGLPVAEFVNRLASPANGFRYFGSPGSGVPMEASTHLLLRPDDTVQ